MSPGRSRLHTGQSSFFLCRLQGCRFVAQSTSLVFGLRCTCVSTCNTVLVSVWSGVTSQRGSRVLFHHRLFHMNSSLTSSGNLSIDNFPNKKVSFHSLFSFSSPTESSDFSWDPRRAPQPQVGHHRPGEPACFIQISLTSCFFSLLIR